MQTRLIRGIGGMPAFMAALVIAAMTALWLGVAATAQTALDADDIGGVVRSPSGPEAGVWVIAETDDFDTRFRKIVVTDDARALRAAGPCPTPATTSGSAATASATPSRSPRGPGDSLDLDAVPAAATRARRRRSIPPTTGTRSSRCRPRTSSPGTGDAGNGISPGMRHQAAWIDGLKQGCQLCHQLGNQATREVLNPRRLRLDRGGVGAPRAAWASAAP